MKYSSFVLATLLMAGCAVGPDYKQPVVKVPESFAVSHDVLEHASHVDRTWWNRFNDPFLSQSVEKALSANYDLKASDAQIDQVLGLFDQAKSNLYPHLNATGSFDRKSVENSTIVNQPNGIRSTTSLSLAMSSYEIDFYGRVRRSTEAAKATLLASEYNKRIVQLSVVANTATSYIKLVTLHDQLKLAKENVLIAIELEKMGQQSFAVGAINESDLSNLSAQVKIAQANVVSLETLIMSEKGTFSTLKGEFGDTHELGSLYSMVLLDVPSGLPSEILAKRPDVLASEQNLISTNAKIGIAYAGYFPSFSLTGMLGVQTSDLSRLLSSPARLWQITPALNIPVFTAGMVSGQVKVAQATYEEALANYQKSVLNALNDTQVSLSNYQYAKDQYKLAQERSLLLLTQYKLTKLRCQQGMSSYANQLAAHQLLIASRKEELTAKQNALIASVSLYKSFGGGWDEKDLPKLPGLYPAGR